MNSLKPKLKNKTDIEIIRVFLKTPNIFRHYLDVALLTRNEKRIRTVQRSLVRLKNAGLLGKYRLGYFLNAEIINSMYGKITDIRKNPLSIDVPYSMGRSVPLELQLIKFFLSEPNGFWTVNELSLLMARAGSTIQYNLDTLCEYHIILKDESDNQKMKTNPISYKLHPTYAMDLSREKSIILKTIKETINQ